MLRNYLKIALRNLRKRVGPTIINVIGLATGLAACLLIGLWINQELSYDDFHPEADRIHRVIVKAQFFDNETETPMVPAPLRAALRREVPEVESVTRIRPHLQSNVLQRDDQAFTVDHVWRADSTFFDVFGGFRLRRGSRPAALDDPNAVVLTASTARRLFGTIDVLGETVQVGEEPRRVTGVLADVPETSHFQFNALTAMGRVDSTFRDDWTGWGFFTYVKLKESASVAAFETKLGGLVQRYVRPDLQEEPDLSPDQYEYAFSTEALTRIHLHSGFSFLDTSGSITTVYVFGAIGLFILLIACVNFMNLATARAGERATEVGMRKALGAGRRQLASQFLGEAVLTTAAATVLALIVAILFLPVFNDLAGTSMGASALLQPTILLTGGVLIAIVGLVSGSYPAFVLSRFSPATTLKASRRHTSGAQDRRVRQGLVVFQFAISIALIVGTLVAQKQFSYIQSKRLGFDEERVVAIKQAHRLGTRQATLVDRLRRVPGVAAAAGEGFFDFSTETFFQPASASAEADESLQFFRVGHGFVETMGIEMVAGRSFDPARPTDSTAVLLNQAAVNAFGFENPTSRRITAGDSATVYDVIGVTGNFHYQSMRKRVKPAAFFLRAPVGEKGPSRNVYARLRPGSPSDALDQIRDAWTEVAGAAAPFQYRFLDRTYDKVHRDIQRAGRLFRLFAALAVVIACLGLFGLAAYTVQRRKKEIGIRKALGATLAQVVGLVSKEFVQLVGIAAVIGLPVAYYGMQQWLQDFAYRTTVGAGVMGGAVVLAAVVAFASISYHAMQAARLDPATTLRDE
jgi:putative ABC transport system permease protein